MRHLQPLQALRGYERRLDRLDGFGCVASPTNHPADAVADDVLDVDLGGHVHVGARVVRQVQRIHILPRQARGQALQLDHRVGQGHANDAVRNRDGCKHRVFVAVTLFVFQLQVATGQHAPPLCNAVAVHVGTNESLKQRDRLQRLIDAVLVLTINAIRVNRFLGCVVALDLGHILGAEPHFTQLAARIGDKLAHQWGIIQRFCALADNPAPRLDVAQLHIAGALALDRDIVQLGQWLACLHQLQRHFLGYRHGLAGGSDQLNAFFLQHLRELLIRQALILLFDRIRLHPLGAHHSDLGQQGVFDPRHEDQKARIAVFDQVIDILGCLICIGLVFGTARQKLTDVVAAEKRFDKGRQSAFYRLENIPTHNLRAAIHLVAQWQAQVIGKVAPLLTTDARACPGVRLCNLVFQQRAERLVCHFRHQTIPMDW